MEPLTSASSSSIEAERLQLFISAVSDYAIFMLSADGIVSSWNVGAQRFKGYQPEEIIGRHFSLFYTDEDRAAGLPDRALKTAREQGKFENEGLRVRKDGSRFWAHVVIDPIRNSAGELLGYTKITRDVTDRKKAAEALRASEEQFRLLVQGVTDYALYLLSPEGLISNWNAGARRINGYEESEAVGTPFSRFYTEEDQAAGLPARALATAAREGRFEGEGWRRRKDGSRFWAHVVIDAIRNDLGELVGFAKITRDVTERRTAAAALESTQEALSASRKREALFQSQKLEAIGKLTGGVAHDFNNLLNVIVSGLDLLRMRPGETKTADIIENMQRAALRGATLTQQLLSFARQQPLKQEKHSINNVIRSFEAVLRRAMKESVRFELQLASSLPLTLIDPAQFQAALLNLAVNAGDAMPDGGSITVSTEQVWLRKHEVGRLAPGMYVKLTVKDTGRGMPAEVAARAVEPFFTTKELGKGTGLGLSQVYGLVQQSNGDLTIATAPGAGTSVSLYLPAVRGQGDEDAMVEAPTGNDKALVVDDQQEVLTVAVELFRTLGYEVLAAHSGEDALDILKRVPDIDVLFSDVVMPGISGIDLGQQARTLVPGIKIILASGYAAPALQDGDTALETFEFIAKPYRVSELIKKLRNAA